MAQQMAEPCRNCGAPLSQGAAFCTICGGTVSNRAASPAPSSVPLGSTGFSGGPGLSSGAGGAGQPQYQGQQQAQQNPAQQYQGQGYQAQGLPGIINVDPSMGGPLLPPVQVGDDPRGAAARALSNAGAGRRLAAKIIDGVPPGILLGAASGIGAALVSTTPVDGGTQLNLTWLLVLLGVGSLLSLAYVVWQWLWEAKSGKTLGNLMLGIRTTNMDGHPAGLLAIFLRSLMVSLSSVVPTVGPILMLISNTWDKNGKRQGWHDKVAHTLVFNVKNGRNPLETGGIAEREKFTPAEVATISPVHSPMARTVNKPGAGAGVSAAAAPSTTPGYGQGSAQGSQQGSPVAFTGSFPGAEASSAAPAPAPAVKGGRRKKKGAAPDPFAPPAIAFQNQPNQQAPAIQFQSQQQGQQGQQFQNQQQFQQFQQNQQGNPFAPPASAPASDLPVASGPITNVPGITRPPVASQSNQQFGQAQGSQQQNFAQAPQTTQEFGQAPQAHQTPQAPAAHADDEAGETRARPHSSRTALRLSFDDGRTEDLAATALIGRNPAGYDGEMISRLISVQDSTRSVSKTHLHLRAAAEGLWVTDRNSTNGSAISTPNGAKSPLVGGSPALAEPGSRVHFGDRSFLVEKA